LCPPLALEYSVTTYNYERQADQDMQNIINPRPKKIVFRWQTKIARQRLVKIDQSKSGVKETYEPLPAGRKNNQANKAEDNMKHIVGWRSAGETLLGRDKKSGNARQD
jgi:hypothetical protein